MVAPEHFQGFARRTHATLFHVFEALPDAFVCICLRGDIQQALIGSGILPDRFGLSFDGLRAFIFPGHEGLAGGW
jgi:hypothetical protein